MKEKFIRLYSAQLLHHIRRLLYGRRKGASCGKLITTIVFTLCFQKCWGLLIWQFSTLPSVRWAGFQETSPRRHFTLKNIATKKVYTENNSPQGYLTSLFEASDHSDSEFQVKK